MTSHSVCMISHEHFMTSHPYRCDIISSIIMTSYPIYMLSRKLLSWKHNDYTWHLTHYIGHHSHCICVVTPTLSVASQQLWKSSHFSTYDIIHTLRISHSHFVTSILSIYDITNTGFMTSDLLYMTSHPWFLTSHPLYLWHHSHYICNITPTMFVNTYKLYLTSKTLC